MLNFRKVLLAAAVAGFALVGTASAQIVPNCVQVSSVTGYIAVEGTTELLPQLVLNCTQPASTLPFAGPISFTLTASGVTYTNQLKTGSTTQIDANVTDSAGDTLTVTQPAANQVVVSSAATSIFDSVPRLNRLVW